MTRPTWRIGVDLGGTKIEAVRMDARAVIVARHRIPTPPSHDYDEILAAIAEVIDRVRTDAGDDCTIGIATPGSLSRASGTMKNCNTTSLNGRRLLDDLVRTLGREVRMANDANCFAVSEAIDGAARGHRIVFGVILGTGVGGGVVIDGVPHEGPNGIAGEWGHTSIDPEGPPCYCGDRGCVETFLSGPGLERDYEARGGAPGRRATDIATDAARDRAAGTPGDAGGRAVGDTGDAGRAANDDAAGEAMRAYLDRFGRSLAGVVDVLDPDCIVLGGGLSAIDALYGEGVRAVARHVFSDTFVTPIVRNAHGDSSGVRGAAMLWPSP